ncbi:hypothetical protein H4218_001169 [Coemansia sp. IMI 209128]|nr:hypothetical protein H4218_001169 [Coemansia sp. IMI 209128]
MHDFCLTSFAVPTYCEYCSGFLWGLTKQGVRCRKCHTTSHKKCAVKATAACTGDRGLATLVRGIGSYDDITASGSSASMSSRSQEPSSPTYARQLDSEFWQQVDEETKINDLVSAQAEQPLSLFQTLPANFMQFTAKLAPISILHHGAQDIVLWRCPRNSLIAMCVYTAYCLRPNLLLVTPLALMIGYILFNFYNSGYAANCLREAFGCEWDFRRMSLASPSTASTASPSPPRSLPQSPPRLLGSGFFSAVSVSGSTASIASSTASGSLRERRRAQTNATQNKLSASGALLFAPTGVSSARAPPITEASVAAVATAVAASGMVGEPNAIRNSPVIPHAGSVATSPVKGKVLVRSRSSTDSKASNGNKAQSKAGSPYIDLSAELGVASFGSAKYTTNVHTTQNLTGTYVGLYDWVAAHNHLVDWSRPAETQHILLVCIMAQAALVVVLYWIPWYLLFLFAGNTGLLAMSPHVRAFAKVYVVEFMLYSQERAMLWWLLLKFKLAKLPLVGRLVSRSMLFERRGPFTGAARFEMPAFHGLVSGNVHGSSSGMQRDGYTTPPLLSLGSTAGSSTSTLMRRPHTVSVYENQRWWLGFGWIPRLGSNERAKWSDLSGKVRYVSTSDFMPEDGFEWADEGGGWEVERLWALPVHTDEDGWVYTDNFWKHPAAAASAVSSYTRRRRWIRKVRPANRPDVSRDSSMTPGA